MASHPRPDKRLHDPITVPDHMPENHRKYLAYNDEDFLSWAAGIGVDTHAVVKSFLESGKVSEQGYKSCASLTKLADKYGCERVERACGRALAYTSQPAIRIISTILKNGQDKLKKDTEKNKVSTGKSVGITRGADYYRRGGADNG